MISHQVIRSHSEDSAARSVGVPDRLPQIPGWHVVRRLGGGSLTEVFQARHADASTLKTANYALKAPSEGQPSADVALELLCREARAARQLNSPHVVPLLAANLRQSPYFIVMPLLPGASLSDVLASGARLVLPVALWIARQVAEALDALQEAGWMHGDVKPSNLMVAPSGHVTLIDLGFAQRLDASIGESLSDQRLTGTLCYLAPELLTSKLRADIRSDLYSLGVMLFETLAGRLPFNANSPAELARQQREDNPENLRIVAPYLPTRVARLVRSLLAKDPARRPSNPREVAAWLADLEIETFAQRASALQY